MLGIDKGKGFAPEDTFSKMLETHVEEIKKLNKEMEDYQEKMEERIKKVVEALDGLSFEDAEAVLESTKDYLRAKLIVKAEL